MKNITKVPRLGGGIVDRSGMIKALSKATTELLPPNAQLSSAALERVMNTVVQVVEAAGSRMAEQFAMQIAQKLADEKLIAAVTKIADTLILRAADQVAGQIAKRLADSQVTNALAAKVADQMADKFAERFSDEKFIAALAGNFAKAFATSLATSTAVIQFQPQQAKGKRKG